MSLLSDTSSTKSRECVDRVFFIGDFEAANVLILSFLIGIFEAANVLIAVWVCTLCILMFGL